MEIPQNASFVCANGHDLNTFLAEQSNFSGDFFFNLKKIT